MGFPSPARVSCPSRDVQLRSQRGHNSVSPGRRFVSRNVVAHHGSAWVVFHLVASVGRGKDGRVMAKVLGESGRFVSQEAVRQRRRIVIRGFVIVGLLGAIGGLVISSFIPLASLPGWIRSTMLIGVLVGLWVLHKWGDGKLDALEKKRVAMLRGASGETTVALALANFPDDYRVINDLTTESGNLDHVVVGPTGVFLLDTKNWRGVVSADGKGELIWNASRRTSPWCGSSWAGSWASRTRPARLRPARIFKLFLFSPQRGWMPTGARPAA